MAAGRPVVVPPGEGQRVGNGEFLVRTADTPRSTFGSGGAAGADANIHAPGGFDRRIGLPE